MKRITVILALTMLAALAASSQVLASGVPQTINLQGRFTDAAGNNVADGVHSVVFRIYDDPVAGSVLWSETLPVQVTGGLFTVLVGNSSAIPVDIFSNGANRYLGVTVNAEPEMPRIPLSSVAYVYQAKDADVATLSLNLTCAGCVSAGEVDPTQVQLRVTGTAPAGQYITGINQNGTVTTAAEVNNVYTAGVGLVLNGTQFAIPPDGVTGTEIAANAVGAAEIATGAVVGGVGGDIAFSTITVDELATGSVHSAEIVDGAVSSADIGTNAIGSDEIAAGAVGTSEVADNSLTAVDITDEPGVASAIGGASFGTLMNGTLQTLLSRAIVVPAAGYVLAIATAEVGISHTAGTNSIAEFGVSSTAGVFPANQNVNVSIASGAPTSLYVQAVTVHGLFSTAGGTHTFYFLGDENSGSYITAELQLTLIYFPTAYGTVVSTAAASGGEVLSSEDARTGAVASETGSEPVQAEVADPAERPAEGPERVRAGFQQELALVKAEMEARIQTLEEHLRMIETRPDEKR